MKAPHPAGQLASTGETNMPYLYQTFMLTLACIAGFSNARIYQTTTASETTFGLFIEPMSSFSLSGDTQSIGLVCSSLWQCPDLVTIQIDPLNASETDNENGVALITRMVSQNGGVESISDLTPDTDLFRSTK